MPPPRSAPGLARRVDVALVRRGLARSRAQATDLVAAGRVTAAGRAVSKPAMRVAADAELRVAADADDPGWVSRGAHKLAGALEVFGRAGVSARGRRCLDVGASTGGFTQVLLHAGAADVVCVDVGHDQLAPAVRADPRVRALEDLDVRSLDPATLGHAAELAVVDVSFISLSLVLPAVVELAAPHADLVVLVKPQFEVGRDRLGRTGVVRDPVQRADAVRRVAQQAAGLGWGAGAVTASRLPGPAGNVEYFLWLRRGAPDLDDDAVARAVAGDPPVRR